MRFVLVVTLVLLACEAWAKQDLSPGKWPEGVLQAYHDQMLGEPGLAEKLRATPVGFSTTGQQGVVATTSGPLAVQAGIQALRAGGTAMDAAF